MDTQTIEKGTVEREKAIALLKFLGREALDYDVSNYDECLFESGSVEYMVLTDEEADEKAAEYVKDSLWAFNASFILSECGLDSSGEKSLQTMQAESCEGANDFILAMINGTCGLEEFVASAISADGRGHFMSSYDGEEEEIQVNGTWYYIYRIN